MALLTWSLGRRNILDVYKIEADKQERQDKRLLGTFYNTTQVYEWFQQMKGLGPAMQTPDSESIKYDDYAPLFTAKFQPVIFTKGLRYSVQQDFTNQYKQIIAKQPDFAKSFAYRRNINAADVYNLGFTDTTYGMNSEVLFSTSHSNGAGATPTTGSNRPAIDIAFGPLALQQCIQEIRRQKGATGQPMGLTGKVLIMGAPEIEAEMTAVIRSMQLAGTNNNDTNEFIRNRTEMFICDFFTSATAWFARMMDNSNHGLFCLDQMPYSFEKFARTDDLLDRYGAYESYINGWKMWQGTWGTTGA